MLKKVCHGLIRHISAQPSGAEKNHEKQQLGLVSPDPDLKYGLSKHQTRNYTVDHIRYSSVWPLAFVSITYVL